MGRLSDISLATQVTVFGNKKAFDQIVREYQSPVRRFFLGQTLGDAMLSDDLAQDTFLKAYTHLSQYRGTSSLLTWLTRIAYNVWYDYCRSEKAKRQTIDTDASDTGGRGMAEKGAPHASLHSSLKMDLYAALGVLREEERVCITMQLIDGYAIDEISDITKMPTGTVKSHLKRGKDKMAEYLRKNGYDR